MQIESIPLNHLHELKINFDHPPKMCGVTCTYLVTWYVLLEYGPTIQLANQDELGNCAHAKDEYIFDVSFFGFEMFQNCFFELVVVFNVCDIWW